MRPTLAAILIAALVLGGCRTTGAVEEAGAGVPSTAVSFTVVSDSVAADPATEALVAPYRQRLADRIAEVIGTAAAPLTKSEPEGSLGNFAADAMLYAVQDLVDEPVHMALTNNGGLRVPIAAGPITVGKLYELMPFENMLSVLTLTGVQVDSLAQQIARTGGEPVAGFSFKILRESGRAVDVRVQGAPLDPDARYRLVTSDYLAGGGGDMPVLWTPGARQDLPVLLRDAFITYVRARGTLEPLLDGRIELK